jgi:hypothetical protein
MQQTARTKAGLVSGLCSIMVVLSIWTLFVSINSQLAFLGRANRQSETIPRRQMCSRPIFILMVLISCPIAGHAATLNPEDASSHLNENAIVCGLFASATYAHHGENNHVLLPLYRGRRVVSSAPGGDCERRRAR